MKGGGLRRLMFGAMRLTGTADRLFGMPSPVLAAPATLDSYPLVNFVSFCSKASSHPLRSRAQSNAEKYEPRINANDRE